MRIAIIGAGGIGAIYGAALAQAGVRGHVCRARRAPRGDAGERAAHRGRPRRDADPPGPGDRRYRRASAPVDYVLLCVKLWDVESAGAQLRPIVGPETAVIPLQNGVDAHERLIPILGREAVMGGTAFVTGSIVAPGVVRQTGTYQHDLRRARPCDQPARRAAARSMRRGRVRRRAQPRCHGADLGEIHRAGAARQRQRADPRCRSATTAPTPIPGGSSRRACARPLRSAAPRGSPCRPTPSSTGLRRSARCPTTT